MADREKVLKALEHHKKTAVCNGCLYEKDADTQEGYCPVYDDAIALLKEQEPVKPVCTEYDRAIVLFSCRNCRTQLLYGQRYCHMCGRAVKWE